jgi:hypothetical protein
MVVPYHRNVHHLLPTATSVPLLVQDQPLLGDMADRVLPSVVTALLPHIGMQEIVILLVDQAHRDRSWTTSLCDVHT